MAGYGSIELAPSVATPVLLHKEVARTFDCVVRVLHGCRWLILVRVGQIFGGVVFPGVMMCRTPDIEAVGLWADWAAISLRTCRAVGRAELIRIVSRSVPVLYAWLWARDSHSTVRIRRHLIRVLLELTGGLASNGAHILAAADRCHQEAATHK